MADAPHPLSRTICGDSSGALRLSHYPAGGRQARHVHDHAQISFLLSGEIEERIGGKSHEPIAGFACVKPAGTDHEDCWGRRGALMLSLRLPALESGAPAVAVGSWGPADVGGVASILRAALAGGEALSSDLLASDLLACIGAEPRRRRTPPPWLARIREAAARDPGFSIAEAAGEAGVHRVHLSRAFAACYGLPLAVYRQQMRLAAAVGETVRSDEPLAGIAWAAGFADQSHMSRALRLATGATPAGLRRLFSPAAARNGRRR
ncbi:MAG TPA: AraC family transcriptional regulator [Allosphingosinicella sp.]